MQLVIYMVTIMDKIRRRVDNEPVYIPGYAAIKAVKENEEKRKKKSEFRKMIKSFLKIYGNFLTDWRKNGS